MKIFILVTLICINSYAQEKPIIQVLKNDFPNKVFGKGYNVKNKPQPAKSHLPARNVREKIFEKAGITNEVSGLDELDRDLLFFEAKNDKPEKLAKICKKCSSDQLKTLVQKIKEEKK